MYVHRRANWEFFAVLEGRCGAILDEDERLSLHTRRLWVFPPETAHGWRGDKARSCKAAIFHFSTVPAPLEKLARQMGHLSIPLTATKARFVERLAGEIHPHYHRMTEKSQLLFDRALLDLSLLALDEVPVERTFADYAIRKVEASVAWYGEHMAEQPKLEQVARAVNVSVRHLRRLFQQVRDESPQETFTKLRIQRSMDLLSQSGRKLDAIAVECGFSSTSDFCRVFRAYRKVSPHAWRRNALLRCIDPAPRRRPAAR